MSAGEKKKEEKVYHDKKTENQPTALSNFFYSNVLHSIEIIAVIQQC
jgi:hypothetical protein